jgi:hypothetical protein
VKKLFIPHYNFVQDYRIIKISICHVPMTDKKAFFIVKKIKKMTYHTELEVWVSLVHVCIKYDQSTWHTTSEFNL